jgi:hypothetical protein
MTITEATRAPGQWSLTLDPDTPRAVRDALQYFGHIVVSVGRPDPRVAGDSLLTSGRYTGVVTGIVENDDATVDLSGQGMAFWLGDADKKGAVLESLVTFTASTFTNAVRTLLPSSGAITEGALHSVTGSYTGTHQWQSPREAIDYVCTTMGAEWRVNNNGTLDAGLASDLFVTTPVNAIVARDSGVDLAVRAMPGHAQLASDVEDFTTRVVLLAQGDGASVATGTADIAPGLNPYKDIHGNTVKLTRMVSESATDQGNAAARAQLALNQFTSPRQAVQLSTDEYDIRGDGVSVGDYVWVHAPDVGLLDLNNEIVFRGLRLNPVKLRIIELAWPVEQGMSVAFRDSNGVWTDLTDYLQFEDGSTTVTVGGYDRSLTNPGSGTEDVGSRPQPNTSVPAAPAFTLPFVQAVYQSTNSGITKAQVQVVWSQPLNVDGTAIIDGGHYEIQYRTGATPIFPSTHAQLAAYTHAQLHAGTNAQPITYTPGPWQTVYVGWDSHQFLIQELTPGVPYDIQIRAVDNGTPANASAWSATTTIQTVGDTLAPSTPAAPSVAASRIAIQVTHTLGRSSGGTYNLEPDLHHLEVHAQYEPTFTPADSTLLGKLICNNGMLIAGIPAVGTFQVESTSALYFKVIAVDEAGNKSNPSTAAQATASLIDDAHISDLTVSKVTAGTITAAWVLAGSIKTATSGARMEADAAGLRLYNPGGTNTVNLSSADGSAVLTGQIQTGTTGKRMVFAPDLSGGAPWTTFYPGIGPTVFLYPSGGVNDPYAFIQTADAGGGGPVNPATTIANWDPTINHVVGGTLNIDNTNVAMVFATSSGTNGYHEIVNTGSHMLYGQFGEAQTFGGSSALYCTEFSVGAGFGSLGIGYGATMAGRINPLALVIDSASLNTYTACSASSATGFTVSYPNVHAVIINVWCFRLS